jgi:hypothetical protein
VSGCGINAALLIFTLSKQGNERANFLAYRGETLIKSTKEPVSIGPAAQSTRRSAV